MRSTPRSAETAVVRPAHTGSFDRILPWLLLCGGLIGLGAAFVLTVEKVALAADSAYVPSCSINPVLNCGSVMQTPQAAVFGFPNSLLGVGGFAVIAAIGAAALAGAAMARWFWVGVHVGVTAAVVFVHWLIAQSLYDIGALCPYCIAVWAVTVPIFWYVTLRNLDHMATTATSRRTIDVLTRNHSVPLTLWFLGVVTLVVERFWSYWSTLL